VRFLVDANLSPRVAEWLRNRGDDAVHVFDAGLNQFGDRQILEEAANSQRILLTADLDFGEILARSAGRVSVVILRLRSTATANVTRRLEVALAHAASALEDGAVVIVGEATLRLRRLPVGR
jgi:predicted nuclease of predicted toxin-antitoxin system